ncbi:T9SS type A sorting domain-containing protein [Maribacter arcticus]|jgi:hypothetical protein|uniref:T9SS type A sorting domain-containing protein n=2 Tax=Maribacter arcticus TaxID=561365 RepID=UPI0030010194
MKNVIVYFIFITAIHVGFSQSNKHEISFDNKNPIKIKLFPNPATNVISVLGLDNSSNASIIITDLYGGQVISHQWVIKHNALNIPVNKLEKGVYLITIQTEHQNIHRKFFKE